jgi:hypothetical protein
MADLTIDSNLSGAVASTVSGTFGAVGPVTIGGIPSSYDFHIKEFPKELPKFVFAVDPLESTVHFDPINLKIDPVETSISIKQIPSTIDFLWYRNSGSALVRRRPDHHRTVSTEPM